MEDYLEAILLLQKEHLSARSKAIAEKLEVRMASVTSALKKLRDKDLINYDSYCGVTLTDKGKSYAETVLQHHQKIKVFLQEALGLCDKEAEANACRMEHVIDKNVIGRLSIFSDWVLSRKKELEFEKLQKKLGAK